MYKFNINKRKFLSCLNSGFILIFVLFFSYFTYFHSDSDKNLLKTVWSYIDDILLYKYSYNNYYSKEDKDYSLRDKLIEKVVIVKIDDKTLNALWKSDIKMLSFSKEIYADFLKNAFEKYKASVVWMDVVFSNKSIYWEEDEKILRDTLERYKNKVVIWTRWDMKDIPLCLYSNVQQGATEAVIENRVRKAVISYRDYNPLYDCQDSKYSYDQVYDWNKNGILYFPVEVYKKYLEKIRDRDLLIKLTKDIDKQNLFNKGYFNINFHKLSSPQKDWLGLLSYSLIDIIEWKELDENWKPINLFWKIVLLWEVWSLLQDKQFSPVDFDNKMPWVAFHANSILTLYLDNSLLFDFNKEYILILFFITIIFLFFIIHKTRLIINIPIIIFLLFFHIVLWTELFARGFIYPVFFFLYSVFIWFIVFYMYKFITTDNYKSFIKKAFSMYLSPEMVDIISKDPSKLKLKWDKRDITIFFSDLVSFTNISEKLSAEELFDFLNDYLSEMTNILTKNSWTLDKYIWDSIMWFFNAPLELENHEYLACKTAIEQKYKLKEINKKRSSKSFPHLEMRIWINSWTSVFWNIWSKTRINFSVIWDNVNLASRLEWANKEYWTTIIVSSSIYEKTKKDFLYRELDTIKVKWKNNKTKIYELIGFPDNKEKDYKNIIGNYEKGLHFYYNWDYESALLEFKKNKFDIPSLKMLSRIKLLKSWEIELENGVFKMLSK